MKEIIYTNEAPKAVGPYSQAIKSNGFIFISGQIPIDPLTNEIVDDDIAVQTRRALDNIGGILKSAGLTFDAIVKTTVFITDLEKFAAMNNIYAEYFPNPPARSTIQVSRLPKNALIEIEAIAVAD
jgi:2-iminobutanoate/2-iminopropanoate deaminase